MAVKGKKLDRFDVTQIEELIKMLQDGSTAAEQAAKAYSSDPISQRNFEIGFLNGYMKTTAQILQDIIK
jgi:hypothetical protein